MVGGFIYVSHSNFATGCVGRLEVPLNLMPLHCTFQQLNLPFTVCEVVTYH